MPVLFNKNILCLHFIAYLPIAYIYIYIILYIYVHVALMAHNRYNLTWGFCHGRECGYLRNPLCLGWCEQCWHEWVDERFVRAARFYPPELQLWTLQQLWIQQRRILRRLRGEDLFCYSSPPPLVCSHGDPIQWRAAPMAIRSSSS
jgi:hypothetical protein